MNLTLFLTAVYHTSKFTPQLIQTLSQASETARLLILTDQSSLEDLVASLDGRAAIILHFPWEFTPSGTPFEEISTFRDFSCVFASPVPASPSPFVNSPRYFQVYRQTGVLDVRWKRGTEDVGGDAVRVLSAVERGELAVRFVPKQPVFVRVARASRERSGVLPADGDAERVLRRCVLAWG